MRAAVGKIKITPKNSIPMGGNVRKDNKSRGVHDDLFCNVLMLNDGATEICLMGFDFVGLKYTTCNDIKKRVSKVTGIPTDNMTTWGTHTHSGPDTCMRMYNGIEKIIDEYLDWVAAEVAKGCEKIHKTYEEVVLKSGKTEVHDLSFNRRLVRKNGEVVMNFEQFEIDDIVGTTGPIDPELITLSIWNKEGKMKSVLVNFTLHPAILVGYEWLISRDYIDELDNYIRNTYGNGVVVLFANGAEGNINHLNFEDPDQWRDFRETKRIGEKLGEYSRKCIDESKELNSRMNYISETVIFPYRVITEEEEKWADMVIERDKDKVEDMFDGIPDKTYAKMIKGMIVRPDKVFKTVLQGLSIGDYAFYTFPGEVYVEFGLTVKKLSPYEDTMIIGLANSQSGYIPKEEAFSQGGYEVQTAWSSQLEHNAGDELVRKITEKLIKPMKGKE
ncbi:MAG: hypothetical protein J7L77_00660 [Clostridiales bacterium]|nr:hypothetical protein [Clostridiales bacterium]